MTTHLPLFRALGVHAGRPGGLALAALALASPAGAHPGHGVASAGALLHYAASPEHALPVALAALGSAAAVLLTVRAERLAQVERRGRRPRA